MNWLDCSAIEQVADRVSGAPVFRGTRVPVHALFENLESGASVSEFLEWFPDVSSGQVDAVLEHIETSLRMPAGA